MCEANTAREREPVARGEPGGELPPRRLTERPETVSMESTGAPSHPFKSRDVVLTEQSRTTSSLDDVGGGLSPREGSEGLSQRARTVGEFRRSSSSSMRDVVVVEARRRRNCPRKSHNVKLEIGRAQAGK